MLAVDAVPQTAQGIGDLLVALGGLLRARLLRSRLGLQLLDRRGLLLDLVDHEQCECALTTGAHDARHASAELCGQEHHVGLELDLTPPSCHQHRRRVAIGDPAPHPRQELGVGLVATQRDHAHGSVGAGRSELALAIFGQDRLLAGTVSVAGEYWISCISSFW